MSCALVHTQDAESCREQPQQGLPQRNIESALSSLLMCMNSQPLPEGLASGVQAVFKMGLDVAAPGTSCMDQSSSPRCFTLQLPEAQEAGRPLLAPRCSSPCIGDAQLMLSRAGTPDMVQGVISDLQRQPSRKEAGFMPHSISGCGLDADTPASLSGLSCTSCNQARGSSGPLPAASPKYTLQNPMPMFDYGHEAFTDAENEALWGM